jgi:hypothetical protein
MGQDLSNFTQKKKEIEIEIKEDFHVLVVALYSLAFEINFEMEKKIFTNKEGNKGDFLKKFII